MKVYSRIYRQGEQRRGRLPGQGLSEAQAEQLEHERTAVDIYKKYQAYNLCWAQGL